MKDTLSVIKEYLLSRRGSLTVCITVGALTVLICAGVLIQAARSAPAEGAPSAPTRQTEQTLPTEQSESAPAETQTEPPTSASTACAHTYERVVLREMTCTEAGESKDVCTKCGKESGPYVNAPTEYHTVDGSEVPKDCGYALYVGKTCDKCGTLIEAREDITHDFALTATAPTCTEDGKTVSTCRLCGYSEESVTPATGHNMLKYNFLLPSCQSAGYEEYRCSNCYATERTELEKLPHEPAEPTCENDGRCEKCYTVLTEALGHDYVYGACNRCDSLEHRAEKTRGVLYQEPGVRNHFGRFSSWFTVYSAKEIFLTESGTPVALFNIDVSYFVPQAHWSGSTYEVVELSGADLHFADGTSLTEHPDFYIDKAALSPINQGVLRGQMLVPLVSFGEYDFTVYTATCVKGSYTHGSEKGFILTVNDDTPGAELLKEYLDNQAS